MIGLVVRDDLQNLHTNNQVKIAKKFWAFPDFNVFIINIKIHSAIMTIINSIKTVCVR